MVLNIPRDRKASLNRSWYRRGSRMSDKLEESIISLYSRGMTTSDISEHVKILYGVDC